jgi:hypothetical protein
MDRDRDGEGVRQEEIGDRGIGREGAREEEIGR